MRTRLKTITFLKVRGEFCFILYVWIKIIVFVDWMKLKKSSYVLSLRADNPREKNKTTDRDNFREKALHERTTRLIRINNDCLLCEISTRPPSSLLTMTRYKIKTYPNRQSMALSVELSSQMCPIFIEKQFLFVLQIHAKTGVQNIHIICFPSPPEYSDTSVFLSLMCVLCYIYCTFILEFTLSRPP